MNILLIDDEESMRHMLSVLLKKAGYFAKSAENAEAGLKAMEERISILYSAISRCREWGAWVFWVR